MQAGAVLKDVQTVRRNGSKNRYEGRGGEIHRHLVLDEVDAYPKPAQGVAASLNVRVHTGELQFERLLHGPRPLRHVENFTH